MVTGKLCSPRVLGEIKLDQRPHMLARKSIFASYISSTSSLMGKDVSSYVSHL